MWTVLGGFAALIAAIIGICWLAIRAADEVDRLEAQQRWGTTFETEPENDGMSAAERRRDRERYGYEP